MTAAVRPAVFQSTIAAYRQPAAIQTAPRRSVLRRIFDAIYESRQRQAERAVEAYLARTGHRFTDSVERELNAHLFNGGWNARR
jgi:DNA-binding FadR family transcriptional regulator